MATINPTDLLYATVSGAGVSTISSQLMGMTSIADVFKSIRALASGISGLVTLKLRNRSQGWQQQFSLMLSPVSAPKKVVTPAAYPSLFAAQGL